jgi:hypothetical protein
MREPQVRVPDQYTLGSHWGLGWILMTWDGRPVYGHDGGTIGQSAFLRIVPDADIAICLLTNGGHTADLFRDRFGEILADLAGITVPARLEPAADPPAVDLAKYVGTYKREGVILTFAEEDGALVMRMKATGELAEMLEREEEQPLQVLPVSEDLFVAKQPDDTSWTPVVFFALDDGTPYVHFGARATPKVADTV